MAAFRAQAKVVETGQSPFAVRIETGGHVLLGDEPVSAGGAGLGPAPYELLASALAECTAMTLRWYAREQGWSVEGFEVSVAISRRLLAGASAPVDVFEKTIAIHGAGLTDEQRTRLLNIAAKCPVQRTLEDTPLITTLVAPTSERGAD